jgi:hypothetical protein
MGVWDNVDQASQQQPAANQADNGGIWSNVDKAESSLPQQTEDATAYTTTEAPFVGFNKGLANLVGAPVDLATWAANKVLPNRTQNLSDLVKETPAQPAINPNTAFMGSEWIKQHLLPQTIAPRNEAERLLQAGGEGGGGMLVPEVGLAGAVESKAIQLAPKTLEMLQEFIGTPKTAGDIATTVATGAGAGVGQELAEQAAPDEYKPLAGLVGGLAGGIPVAAGASLLREAPSLIRTVQESPITETGAEKSAVNQFTQAANVPRDQLADQLSQPQEIVPGSKPTSYQLTGNEGLGQQERAVQQTDDASRAAFQERRAEQNAARLDQINKIQENGEPTDVANFLRNEFNNVDATTNASVEAVTKDAIDKIQSLGGTQDPESLPTMAADYGQKIRNRLQDIKDADAQQRDALYQAVDPNGTVNINTADAKDAITKMYLDMGKNVAQPTGEEKAIQSLIMQTPDVETFRDWHDLDKRVTAAMSQEKALNGESEAYRRLVQVKKAMAGATDQAVGDQVAADRNAVANNQIAPENTIEGRLQNLSTDRPMDVNELTPEHLESMGYPYSVEEVHPPETEVTPYEPLGPEEELPENPPAPLMSLHDYIHQAKLKIRPDKNASDFIDKIAKSYGKAWNYNTNSYKVGTRVPKGALVDSYSLLAKPGERALTFGDVLESVKEAKFLDTEGAATPVDKEHADLFNDLLQDPKNAFPMGEDEEQLARRDYENLRDQKEDIKNTLKNDEIVKSAFKDAADRRLAARYMAEMGYTSQQAVDAVNYFKVKNMKEPTKSLSLKEVSSLEQMGYKRDEIATMKPDDARYLLESAPPELLPGGAKGEATNSSPERIANLSQADIDNIKKAKEFAKAYSQKYHQQNAIGQIMKTNGFKEQYKLPDASVVSKLFPDGDIGYETGLNYRRVIGDDPASLDLMRDYVASSMLRSSRDSETGLIDPKKFDAWRQKKASALRAFPEIASQFETPLEASKAVGDAAAKRNEILDNYQKGIVGNIMKLNSPTDIERTIGGIFNKKDSVATMDQLAKAVASNPDAKEGLRKAVVDHIMGKTMSTAESGTTGERLIKADALQKFIQNNREALSKVFTPDELKTWDNISADLRRSNRSIVSSKIPGSPGTAQDLAGKLKDLGKKSAEVGPFSLGAMLSHTVGAKGAAAIAFGKYVAGKMLESGINNRNDLLRRMHLDPEFAAEMLRKYPESETAQGGIKFRNLLNRMSVYGAANLVPGQNREERASGGRIMTSDQMIAAADRIRKNIGKTTEPLLSVPDEAIAKALAVANEKI